MAYVVYITDKCKEDAKKHSYEDSLKKIKEDIEQKQTLQSLDTYPADCYSTNKFNYNMRAIVCKKYFIIDNEEYAAIIFVSVTPRSSEEYKKFKDRKHIESKREYHSLYTDKEVEDYIKDQIEKKTIRQKEPLDKNDSAYLDSANSPDYELKNEDLIYESDDWIESMSKETVQYIMSDICSTIEKKVLDGSHDSNYAALSTNNNWEIIYQRHGKNVFLFDMFNIKNSSQNKTYIFDKWNKKISNENETKVFRRAYQQYHILEPEFWYEIEKDPLNNFTLSGEQIEILKSLKGKVAFPLFINGRAGSGKSTILQYLFADYFLRYLSYKDNYDNPPVYLTYNSELLKNAKEQVVKLLLCNAAYKQDQISESTIKEKTETAFKELKKYLASLVQEDMFVERNYINYTLFQKLWQEKYGKSNDAKKKYPAIISWHIIRTYIQGMDSEDYLELEDYEDLDKGNKTVEPETYKLVYDTVWK